MQQKSYKIFIDTCQQIGYYLYIRTELLQGWGMSEELVGQDVITDARIKQVAAAIIANKSMPKIVEELKLTPYMVNKIKKTSQFKDYLKEITDTVIEDSRTTFKHEIAKRTAKVLKALDEELEGGKGRMEAIKTALRVMGVLDPAEGGSDNAPIVVNFSGLVEPDANTITVQSKPVQGDGNA